LLRGGEARRDAVRTALHGASALHVDAHARYEPAFPELSTLLLADGPLTGQELAAWSAGLALANLSGCRTGRAPVTADSGRFGMAGLLVRAGVPWVVASRAALHNDLAQDFNRAFHDALARGEPVPLAYGRALGRVRDGHPASHWAVLVLLRGSGGQSPPGRTPSPMEGARPS
jgi:CHAT domain-containing protein